MIFWERSYSHAQLSPGPLHESHKDLEGMNECGSCHDSDRSGVADNCLSCHTLLKHKIDRGVGLHGLQEYSECELCHVEHHGRDYDLIWWDGGTDKFDHALTGYPLQGAHGKIECRICHRSDRVTNTAQLIERKKDLSHTFFGLDTTCTSCHNDEHRGQLASTCDNCHTLNVWKPAPGFDHDKTDYRLAGKHISTPCAECHREIRDADTPDDPYLHFANVKHESCFDCHQDSHEGRLGDNCTNCHTPEGWHVPTPAVLDHGKTRYPLQGRHASVTCVGCHKPGLPHKGLKYELCSDCHADFHKGEFASRTNHGACEECHTVDGFIPSMFTLGQHDQSDYPLDGAHLAVACLRCHPKATAQDSESITRFVLGNPACRNCHADRHNFAARDVGYPTECSSCHKITEWQAVDFNHDSTDFALTGRHGETACIRCHEPSESAQASQQILFTGLHSECNVCHEDPHRGQFAGRFASQVNPDIQTDCQHCHSTQHWLAKLFDHNRMAHFKLEGAHQKVPCAGCHMPVEDSEPTFVRYSPLGNACKDCHGRKYAEEDRG